MSRALRYIPGIAAIWAVPFIRDLKNRKKFEPTSTARPAFSAASIARADVMPVDPSAAGQSAESKISTGRTSHQIEPVLVSELSTTWLWFGVGRKMLPVGGLAVMPSAPSSVDRSTDDACIVQVPGTGLFGSGHCVATAGWLSQAFGM